MYVSNDVGTFLLGCLIRADHPHGRAEPTSVEPQRDVALIHRGLYPRGSDQRLQTHERFSPAENSCRLNYINIHLFDGEDIEAVTIKTAGSIVPNRACFKSILGYFVKKILSDVQPYPPRQHMVLNSDTVASP